MSEPPRGHNGGKASDGSRITVIGNVNIDWIMGPVTPWPKPGTEIWVPHSELRVGGAAGNAAFALKAMGAPYRIVASVGNDMFGRWLAQAFGAAARRWPVAPVATTASVGITYPNGERTFFTSAGHLDRLSLGDVMGQLPKRARAGEVALLLGGFLSPPLLGRYEALLAQLRRIGFAIALDPSWPPQGWAKMRRRVAAWLSACDHVLLNEAESCALSGEDSVAKAGPWIERRARPGATVIIKQGPRGASAWQDGRKARAVAPRVKVVDTIGAGDVFDAAYLRARCLGAGLAEALSEGVRVASAVVSTYPRRYGPVHHRRRGG
jgi:sugar/nucleoside kinase (ribokinase family)